MRCIWCNAKTSAKLWLISITTLPQKQERKKFTGNFNAKQPSSNKSGSPFYFFSFNTTKTKKRRSNNIFKIYMATIPKNPLIPQSQWARDLPWKIRGEKAQLKGRAISPWIKTKEPLILVSVPRKIEISHLFRASRKKIPKLKSPFPIHLPIKLIWMHLRWATNLNEQELTQFSLTCPLKCTNSNYKKYEIDSRLILSEYLIITTGFYLLMSQVTVSIIDLKYN